MLVMNVASGSGEAVVNCSLNVGSTGLRVQMPGSSSDSVASFGGSLLLPAAPITRTAPWGTGAPWK